jgi:hypothetical protein
MAEEIHRAREAIERGRARRRALGTEATAKPGRLALEASGERLTRARGAIAQIGRRREGLERTTTSPAKKSARDPRTPAARAGSGGC